MQAVHNGDYIAFCWREKRTAPFLRRAGIVTLQQMGGFLHFAISRVRLTSKIRLCPCSFSGGSREQIMKLSCQSHAIHVFHRASLGSQPGSLPAAPSFRL